jgi:hypothetical protein
VNGARRKGGALAAGALLSSLLAPAATRSQEPAPAPASTETADQVAAERPAPRIAEGRDLVDLAVAPIELEAHVGFLAADELAGRDTGSAGEALAVAYLADRLRAAGLEPAGDDGYLQQVELERARPLGEPRLRGYDAAGEPREFAFGTHFTVYEWSGLDARLPLVRAEDPQALPEAAGAALFVASDAGQRRAVSARAAQLGVEAPAVLLFPGPRSDGRPGGRLPRGELARTGSGPRLPAMRVRGELLEQLEQGLLVELELRLELDVERIVAHNVVALLRGRGTEARPELARQAVVLSAHIDHLGVEAPAEGDGESGAPASGEDRIYNGADDDASGVAAVLEVAEALAQGPAPARTVVVLLATGEERGLLGTHEYLARPAVSLEHTVYNLNFEMLGRPDALAGGPGQLWLTGYERTNLGAAWAALGVAFTPDPRPDQHFFERSDNIAFVDRGVPGQTLSSFDLHGDYHRVTDEWWTLDYEHLAAACELAARAARLLVDGAVDPAWLEGGQPPQR